MKTLAVEVLTAVVVVGGALFARDAWDLLPDGKSVLGVGTGQTVEVAGHRAVARAVDQCESRVVAAGGSFDTAHYVKGMWTSTYTGKCTPVWKRLAQYWWPWLGSG